MSSTFLIKNTSVEKRRLGLFEPEIISAATPKFRYVYYHFQLINTYLDKIPLQNAGSE
jgi:hypothetical protein